MSSPIFVFLLVLVADGVLAGGREREEISFDQNYEVIWDGSFVVPLNQGKEIQLTMDKSSGYNKPFSLPLSRRMHHLSFYLLYYFYST